MKMLVRASLVLPLVVASCSGDGGSGPEAQKPPPDDGPVVIDGKEVFDAKPATVDVEPTTPKDDTGKPLAWSTAPLMSGVQVVSNRDSAILVVPAVAGARDYRVMLVRAGVDVKVDAEKETVDGTTIFCAGYRQHSAKAGPLEVMRQIEVAGLTGETRLVVEAIDGACPFTGIVGRKHVDVTMTNDEVPADARVPFAIYTEPEVTATYGSMIFNGHGKGPKIGLQAPPVAPKVLARTTVKVTPLGYAAEKPTQTFFDDFETTEQPATISEKYMEEVYQSSKWTFYSYNDASAQPFFDRGRMRWVLADLDQEIFASMVGYPRKPVQLSATDYLHVTFRVASMSTSRRYWWISLCGAAEPGKTMTADGMLTTQIKQTPFFMDDDGKNPSADAGWNCLQVFPRGGWPFELPPDDKDPESEVRVMLNAAGNHPRDNVINVSPKMYDASLGPKSWYRQIDASGNPVAPMLDDQQLTAPNARFDMFIRRDRFVMYVNGEQRICNDFAGTPLTMAEGALGFGSVLYHSTADRLEVVQDFWDKSGMRYLLENVPYLDDRTWDEVGYDEHVALPSGGITKFDPSVCYKSK
jgi:hypothetical protein